LDIQNIEALVKRTSKGLMKKIGAASKSLISVTELSKIKILALRQKVWYKSLNHLERSIIDLTVKYVDSIKSAKLAQVVTGIVSKLESALESIVDRLARSVGLSLAQKISSIAVSWGNRSAHAWADDLAFARYLAVTNHNIR
jgi:hypothetical protein